MRKLHFDTGDMAIALILWLCTLPLIGLTVLPLLGLRAAAITALGLFILFMAICWGICGWKVRKNTHRSSVGSQNETATETQRASRKEMPY